MNEMINIQHEFISTFESILSNNGFEKEDINTDVQVYKRIRQAQLPGQIISINGQTMEQPGQIVDIQTVVYILGDGWIADMDESNKRNFTQIRLYIMQGDMTIHDYEGCFYWDDIDFLKQIIKNFDIVV